MLISPGEIPPNGGDEKKVDDEKKKNKEKEVESSDENSDYDTKSVKVTKRKAPKPLPRFLSIIVG
jgi:hypothetical protein